MNEEELKKSFEVLKGSEKKFRCSSVQDRILDLKRLEKAIVRDEQKIRDAIFADFSKPAMEVNYSEIYLVLSEIRTASKHLRDWMRPRSVSKKVGQIGTRSWILPESKGVSLIMAPWNYPFTLSMGPLVSAIAAGCPVMVKPSEFAPKISAYMSSLISELFPEDHIKVIEGNRDVASALLKLPFRHIFFTGSQQVGKIVMKSAAEHLSSVTLELGGKSPVIIDRSANIAQAAKRIVYAKWLNAGQTCIAADYILVDRSVSSAFLERLKSELELLNTEEGRKSYCGIIHQGHFDRLNDMLKDALTKGAELIYGQEDSGQKMGIKVLLNPSPEAQIMQEEIFGPLLPVIEVDSFETALTHIAQKETPLSAYLFTKKLKNQRVFLNEVICGTTCVNDVLVHFSNDALPFGGVHQSGMGKAHGLAGFEAFSHQKAVLKRTWAYNWLSVVYPPYNGWKQKISNIVLRYF